MAAAGYSSSTAGSARPRASPRCTPARPRRSSTCSRCTQVVVSHGHVDHFGNAQLLSELSGAPVRLHPGDTEKVVGEDVWESRAAAYETFLRRQGVPEDQLPRLLAIGQAQREVQPPRRPGPGPAADRGRAASRGQDAARRPTPARAHARPGVPVGRRAPASLRRRPPPGADVAESFPRAGGRAHHPARARPISTFHRAGPRARRRVGPARPRRSVPGAPRGDRFAAPVLRAAPGEAARDARVRAAHAGGAVLRPLRTAGGGAAVPHALRGGGKPRGARGRAPGPPARGRPESSRWALRASRWEGGAACPRRDRRGSSPPRFRTGGSSPNRRPRGPHRAGARWTSSRSFTYAVLGATPG